ncbi:LOW QUALITY PROTEIN: uncharacterized protein [Rutidosis leptorrhynchoides]|uniref:LOW QUALITY PROTEIN: uncharacterized protein n=1 Tax=Rutidosis leptorrhynchoides TaxID=125765 RepID=UPI003A996AC1
MDIWSWICELPSPNEWSSVSDPPFMTFQLSPDDLVTFTVSLQTPNSPSKTIWVSDTCPLSSDKPYLPLFLQLLHEIISHAPVAHRSSACTRQYSQLLKLKPEPISWIMDSHSPESFSKFFDLVFLTRLFFLCVFQAPSQVGSFYFDSLYGPNVELLSSKNHTPVLKTFLVTVGVDIELSFIRTLGYILSKWLIFRQTVNVGLQALLNPLPRHRYGFCYGMEAHGYWILKGSVPVHAMKVIRSSEKINKFPVLEPKESILRYVLAHQQLEAVIQLEYSVRFDNDGFIQVNARVDNLRLHVARLGFSGGGEQDEEDLELGEEMYFPSRIRVWVGPDIGSNYVSGLSLGRSTNNEDCEVEMQRVLKGDFGKAKVPQVKTRSRMSTRTKVNNWRWDQDAEGNVAVFESVLCDNVSGHEIATWRETTAGGGGFRNRYNGANRHFSKSGGLVFARDEYGEEICWRLNKEMEGSVLKWRIGGQVWLTYWPNHVKSSFFETRCIEWCDEVDLPLIPPK